jgi:hypothetical protein
MIHPFSNKFVNTSRSNSEFIRISMVDSFDIPYAALFPEIASSMRFSKQMGKKERSVRKSANGGGSGWG